jgi:hypothetical protein
MRDLNQLLEQHYLTSMTRRTDGTVEVRWGHWSEKIATVAGQETAMLDGLPKRLSVKKTDGTPRRAGRTSREGRVHS